MPKLIRDGQLVKDYWTLVEVDTDLATVLSSQADHLLLPANFWLQHKSELAGVNAKIGLWFDSSQNPAEFDETFEKFPLIALAFPQFKDGRAYSYAAIVRKQLNYSGEIRAIGDVLRDQLTYMLRCGFNSFLLADDADVETCLNGFHDFSENYQSTVSNPTPLFRRRR
jgi:uncharacterized protein (DUF934 family)